LLAQRSMDLNAKALFTRPVHEANALLLVHGPGKVRGPFEPVKSRGDQGAIR